ncbi:MAG: LD-carboxypeptidase [Blautia sp.]
MLQLYMEDVYEKGDKIGIVACSNGLKENSRQEMEYLKDTLEELGLIPVFSRYLYAGNGVESAGRRKRAEELMNFYRDRKRSKGFLMFPEEIWLTECCPGWITRRLKRAGKLSGATATLPQW